MSSVINIEKILKSLPHRYPLLLVDKVLSLEPGKNIVAIKNVTFNEPHFLGHFQIIQLCQEFLLLKQWRKREL